jgi:hypothetical protein
MSNENVLKLHIFIAGRSHFAGYIKNMKNKSSFSDSTQRLDFDKKLKR